MKSIFRYIPNSITITRIFMSLIFSYLITEQFSQGKGKFMYLMIVFFMICFSDFLDGKVARKTGSVSVIGAKLDVFSDLIYMILSYTTLIILKILPLWFLGFICLKFLEFIITSNFIKQHNKLSNNPFVFDKVGRAVAVNFFIIPGLVCIFSYFMPYIVKDLIMLLLYATLAAGIYSSYLRIKNCFMIKDLNASSCTG